MSKKIPIENFLKMMPDVPQYSEKNQNYLMAGVNPTYYLDTPGTQEQQIGPLAASLEWKLFSPPMNGNVVHMIPATDATYAVYAITDTTKVYGIKPDFTVVDLNYPSGGSVGNSGGRLAIAGGTLFAVYTGTVYKNTLPATNGGWSALGTGISSPGGIHFMEPFLDYIALADAPAGGDSYQWIDKVDVSAFTITKPATAGLDLGIGWGIIGLRNYNNKYLAIAAGRTLPVANGQFGFPQNFIFLWDGISSRYQYSVKIPGQYLSMKVIDSVLYVAVQTSSGNTKLYYLSNVSLKEVFTPAYSKISNLLASPVSDCIFDFKGNVGLRLQTTSDFANPLMIYGKQEVGATEFILSTTYLFDQFCVGYDGVLYASFSIPYAGGQQMAYYPLTTQTNYYYNEILYRSQWIPVQGLTAIDIYYDTPPAAGTNAINVTIYGRGEDIITGSSTTALQSISPTNYLNAKRTRLDVKGFTGSQVKIQLSTVNVGTTWQPIIRAIVPITK